MEDHGQGGNTTSRRSRKTVFKGPIHGFIHHARGRGEVVAYSDTRGATPERLVSTDSDTVLHENFSGDELQPGGSSNENRDNSGDIVEGARRQIQQAQRSPPQDSGLPGSRTIIKEFLRRAAEAGPARSTNQVGTTSAIQSGIQDNRGSDENILGSGNGPDFKFSQLENEFRELSPDMQRYLTWLQRTTGSEYRFAYHDQAAPTDVQEDEISQR